jgi:uncharacterized membrane protein YkoI
MKWRMDSRRGNPRRVAAGFGIALAAAALLASGSLHADSRDHDEVRHAVEKGEIRPLANILDSVRQKLPGEVIKVGVEREKGRWIYELRVIDDKGRLFEVKVDARSGEVERIKEK